MQVDIIFQHYYQVAKIRSNKKIPYPNFDHPKVLAFCKIKQNMAALWLVYQPDMLKIKTNLLLQEINYFRCQ